jgi:hypothetical protein
MENEYRSELSDYMKQFRQKRSERITAIADGDKAREDRICRELYVIESEALWYALHNGIDNNTVASLLWE